MVLTKSTSESQHDKMYEKNTKTQNQVEITYTETIQKS